MDSMQRVPRMRTAARIVAELKALDPGTDMTESCIRRLAKQGVLTVIWAGNKALINLDDVLELMRLGTDPPEEELSVVGGIRKISTKACAGR